MKLFKIFLFCLFFLQISTNTKNFLKQIQDETLSTSATIVPQTQTPNMVDLNSQLTIPDENFNITQPLNFGADFARIATSTNKMFVIKGSTQDGWDDGIILIHTLGKIMGVNIPLVRKLSIDEFRIIFKDPPVKEHLKAIILEEGLKGTDLIKYKMVTPWNQVQMTQFARILILDILINNNERFGFQNKPNLANFFILPDLTIFAINNEEYGHVPLFDYLQIKRIFLVELFEKLMMSINGERTLATKVMNTELNFFISFSADNILDYLNTLNEKNQQIAELAQKIRENTLRIQSLK